MTILRSVLFNFVFFVVSSVLALAGLVLVLAPARYLRRWIQIWARMVLGLLRGLCGIRLRVTGLEHLPSGAAVIAAKHQSAFDTIVWLALLEAPAYVLKRELLSVPVWGLLAKRAGHIAVDRAAGASALRSMVREARGVLDEGRPIIIFPEGTRSQPGERLPYQPGVVALAGLGAPVVPVATDSGLCWGRRAFIKRPGTIHLSILPPLPPGLSRSSLLGTLEAAIEEESARLLQERPAPDER
ncbi:MAG TPA: lysophospholipid acyltransferase family protein [Acetobacteraceae bacterium]|nr:lysophospholipid acyltransferase family protein [Acetobacteraceae bacterium]